MRKLCLAGLLSLVSVGVVLAEPVSVYDVSVTPDSPNKKVTVQYRLGESVDRFASVGVNISSNAGESWSVPANTFYPGSDVGSGVAADGSLRTLVWDARADWNNSFSTQMIMRLEATASVLQSQIYFTAGNNLYRMNLDGSAPTVLASGVNGVRALIADPASQMIYMVKWDTGTKVYFYDVAQGGTIGVIGGTGSGGQGVAYDPATGHFFCALYYGGLYSLANRGTETWQRIVSPTQLSPLVGIRGNIFCLPSRQQVYFRGSYNGYIEGGTGIWRVNYNGTGLTRLMDGGAHNALALDQAHERMYFSEGQGGEIIKRSSFDGTNVETIYTLNGSYICCTAMSYDDANDKIYMYLLKNAGDSTAVAIARVNSNGTAFEILYEAAALSTSAWGLAVFPR
jgi:hypothetical protein